jgi:hypothetical protein
VGGDAVGRDETVLGIRSWWAAAVNGEEGRKFLKRPKPSVRCTADDYDSGSGGDGDGDGDGVVVVVVVVMVWWWWW